MFLGEAQQLWQTGHRAVIIHDFTDHPCGSQARQGGQINGRLSMSGSAQDPSSLGSQREDMPGLDEICGCGRWVHHDLDGLRSIGGADAGADAFGSIDADLEVGLISVAVLNNHLFDAQLLESLSNGRNADQSSAMFGHEVDRIRGHLFGSQYQITLVFTILVIHDNHHFAQADIAEDGGNVVEWAGLLHVRRLVTDGGVALRGRGLEKPEIRVTRVLASGVLRR